MNEKPACFDNGLKTERNPATTHGATCKVFARPVVILTAYLNEAYTERNLLDVKSNRFPTSGVPARQFSPAMQISSYFLVIIIHFFSNSLFSQSLNMKIFA